MSVPLESPEACDAKLLCNCLSIWKRGRQVESILRSTCVALPSRNVLLDFRVDDDLAFMLGVRCL